jgi:hypothetical protein
MITHTMPYGEITKINGIEAGDIGEQHLAFLKKFKFSKIDISKFSQLLRMNSTVLNIFGSR